jgi:hypothetical protein
MPLPESKPRTLRHTRRIELNGYEREDGLWDIEAHLVDTKAYEFRNHFRGPLTPGEPIHDLWLRLTVDDGFTIRAVEACTDYAPFPSCPEVAPNYQALVGMRIGSGWTDQVRQKMGLTGGCTHLFELLRPLATVAIQTIMPLRKRDPEPGKRPRLLDTCYGWRAEGEAIREVHPAWHRLPQE